MDVSGQFYAPATLLPERQTPYPLTGDMMGFKASSNGMVYRKIPACAINQNPAVHPVASHYNNLSTVAYTKQ
jgi:hypothetical protein